MPTLLEHWRRHSLRKAGFETRTLPTGAGALHVMKRQGQGSLPWTVLLHGFGSAGVFVAPLAERLLPAVKGVVILDLPGHGFSPVPPGGLFPKAVREASQEALAQITVPKPWAFLGNSLGGLLAIRMTQAQPEATAALALLSPAGTPMTPAERERFFDTFRIRNHQHARRFVDKLLGAPPTFSSAPMRELVALDVRTRLGDPELQRLLEAAGEEVFLSPAELRALPVPTFVMFGAGDGIMPPSHPAFFREHLPEGGEFSMPSGLGHSPYLDDPALVAWQILRFWDRKLRHLS